jgi:hypothetical protein
MIDLQYNHALIPSGIFIQPSKRVCTAPLAPVSFKDAESPLSNLDIQLCNPMPVRPVDAVIVKEIQPKFATAFQNDFHRLPVIGMQELYSYAEKLLEIGRTLASRPYDLVVIPLRGGLKPWLQLDVLREFQQSPLWLPYTAGSQGKYDEQVLHIIEQGIAKHAGASELRIAVIDTAISGDGSLHLAGLLSQRQLSDRRQRWICDFHLLHAKQRFPTKSNFIRKLSNENLQFKVVTWPVDHLLVEDWNEAIGLEVHWEGSTRAIIKHCSTEGRLLLKRIDGSIQLIESPELHHYVDLLLGDAVSEYVRHDAHLVYQRDVWQRYIDR